MSDSLPTPTFTAPIVDNGTLVTPLINSRGTFSVPTYAMFDPAQNPSRIKGWIDYSFHAYPDVDPETLAPISAELWDVRLTKTMVVANDTVVEFVAPPPTKAELKAKLAAIRYQHETSGIVVGGTLVATDPISRGNLVGAFVAATAGLWVAGTPWKAADGSFLTVTADVVKAVATQAQTYVAHCYTNEAMLAAQIDAASDPSTVDLTVGWPSNT